MARSPVLCNGCLRCPLARYRQAITNRNSQNTLLVRKRQKDTTYHITEVSFLKDYHENKYIPVLTASLLNFSTQGAYIGIESKKFMVMLCF
jgi:hypothetical protein